MNGEVKILGFAGSLRKASLNKRILQAARNLVPKGAVLETFDLEGIPLFNQDLEPSVPATVLGFKAKIRASDAILIVTGEYNYGIPGVLKNAIDRGSRPPGESAWNGKPVAILGASPGRLGTARAQYQLRQLFDCLNMSPVNSPEVLISRSAECFDESGDLKDGATRSLIRELLNVLVRWTRQLQKANAS